jgi:hypothetical protein
MEYIGSIAFIVVFLLLLKGRGKGDRLNGAEAAGLLFLT